MRKVRDGEIGLRSKVLTHKLIHRRSRRALEERTGASLLTTQDYGSQLFV